MIKIYKSKSAVSISVFFKKTGKSKRVSFSPLTGGGSVYYSKDKDEQDAIEANANFGRLFKLAGVQNVAAPAKEQPGKATGEKPHAQVGPEVDTAPVKPAGNKEPVHVKYTNIPDAKEYLCTNFSDVSRTKVRTKEDVKAIGIAHNIIFDGLE